MALRILVLEDDGPTCRLLAATLTEAGYSVATYGTLAHATAAIHASDIDLYLLDLSLPDGDGLTLCASIRTRSQKPIIILTMRGALADIEKGLELGADDYITKPFQIREVVARVRAQLRRSASTSSESTNVIRSGDLLLDRETRDVFISGRPIALSPKEYDVLELLAVRAGRAVNKELIVDRLWGDAEEISDKILAVYIRRLRCKLELDPDNPRYVQTVRGVGYRLGA
jgi:DNA-binding response OmpR family regulator